MTFVRSNARTGGLRSVEASRKGSAFEPLGALLKFVVLAVDTGGKGPWSSLRVVATAPGSFVALDDRQRIIAAVRGPFEEFHALSAPVAPRLEKARWMSVGLVQRPVACRQMAQPGRCPCLLASWQPSGLLPGRPVSSPGSV